MWGFGDYFFQKYETAICRTFILPRLDFLIACSKLYIILAGFKYMLFLTQNVEK